MLAKGGKGQLEIAEFLFERLFGEKDRKHQQRRLHQHCRSGKSAKHIRAAMQKQQLRTACHSSGRPAHFPAQPPVVGLGKPPGVRVLHGAPCAITEKAIDPAGAAAAHDRPGKDHGKGDQQITQQHKTPKSHKLVSFHSVKRAVASAAIIAALSVKFNFARAGQRQSRMGEAL